MVKLDRGNMGSFFAGLRRQWAGYLSLFLVVAGGTAFATHEAIRSSDIVNNEVRTADVRDDSLDEGGLTASDLRANSVRSSEVRDDALAGADIDETTLKDVNADTVRGLQVRKVNFQAPPGTGPTTVLDLGGLQITAECQAFGDFLDVKAFTSKNGASIFYVGVDAAGASDTDAVQDIDSSNIANGFFNTGAPLEIDNLTPQGEREDAVGTLNYSAPDGSVVVVHLAFDEIRSGPAGSNFAGCALTGIASGG